MKRLSTLILSLTLSMQLVAQGYLSTPLGSDSNTVLRFLSGRKAEMTWVSEGLLRAQSGGLVTTYSFHNGKLYEVNTEKTFATRRQAEESYQEFLSYFQSIQTPFSETKGNNETQLNAMNEKEVNMIRKSVTAGGVSMVEHKTISLIWQPGTSASGSFAMIK